MKFTTVRAKYTLKEFFRLNFDERNLWEYKADEVDLLAELIHIIRPSNLNLIQVIDIDPLLSLLYTNDKYCKGLATYVNGIFKNKKFSKILTDAGILTDSDFFFEVKKRLFAKLIPEQSQKDTLEYVLNQVFYLKTDPEWIKNIPPEQVTALYGLLGFKSIYETGAGTNMLEQLIYATDVLIYRIAGRALETNVIKMVPEYEGLESPFLAFQKELALLSDKILNNSSSKHIAPDDDVYRQVMILHRQCVEYDKKAFRNSEKYGISLRVNQSLLRIRQQLKRLKVILPLLVLEDNDNATEKSIQLAFALIEYNCNKNNVRRLINESTQLLSYEVTQHTAKTGEHYITKDRKEYFKMFKTAAGGGLVVGILCIIKVFLGKIDTSAFGHAFFYSLNYSIGFITIYVLGFTLATKQPAMTAAALVSALEAGRKITNVGEDEKHRTFAEFFARVFRSQFIAFVGNVIVAFPVSLLGIWLIDVAFNYNLAVTKWYPLINDISPVNSPAIFHAAIAGVFLFLSGIIAGSVANTDKHQNIYFRIQEHPLLKMTFGKIRTKKLATIYEKKWAGIISNFWFGIFMGSTASIGFFLGINIDIRHITFVSGNLALGLYGANFNVANEMLFWGIAGIGIIGLVNFLVSFGLSLGLAFRSRNIPVTELTAIAAAIWKHFKKKPGSFFFPNFRAQTKE